MANVGDLLRRSRNAHAQYRSVNLWNGKAWEVGDQVVARTSIAEARTLRQQADEADPERTDPEWRNDRANHTALMVFYDTYLGTH